MDDFLLEMDLSQVESRIVYILTRDPKLVAKAQSNPWEYDQHSENAKAIYGVQEPTEKQRFLGKIGVHGAQRGMMGKTLSENILKETNGEVVMTSIECQWLIDKYFEANPAIKSVYFKEVREEIWAKRMLTNSWGRECFWPYARFDEALYRECYSWRPQSDAADLLNQQGLIPIYEFIKQNKLHTALLAQIHDSILFNTNIKEAYLVACHFKASVEKPVQYPAGALSVPCTLKIGTDWSGYREWRKFPTEDAFEAEVSQMLH